MKDNLGRHWRVKGSSYQAFTRDAKTGKDSVEVEVPLVATQDIHKCGGTMMRVAHTPKLLGEWLVCGKCSAEIRRDRDEEYQRR